MRRRATSVLPPPTSPSGLLVGQERLLPPWKGLDATPVDDPPNETASCNSPAPPSARRGEFRGPGLSRPPGCRCSSSDDPGRPGDGDRGVDQQLVERGAGGACRSTPPPAAVTVSELARWNVVKLVATGRSRGRGAAASSGDCGSQLRGESATRGRIDRDHGEELTWSRWSLRADDDVVRQRRGGELRGCRAVAGQRDTGRQLIGKADRGDGEQGHGCAARGRRRRRSCCARSKG